MTRTNIFEIEHPKIYRCNVLRYDSGLSRLYIRVFKGMSVAPSFYLFFSDVGYFEGPVNWEGVGFNIESSEKCLSLMVDTGMVRDIMLDDPDTRLALAEAAQLYTLQTPHSTIRIVAGSAVKMDKLPGDT